MSTITTKPARKRSAPRKKSAADLPEGSSPEVREPPTAESGGNAHPMTARTTEHEAEHALEHALEALSVDHQTAERIQRLPHDVGWLLVTAGVVGVFLPGVLGVPFLLLGGLILMPGTNQRAERWLTGHTPKIFKGSVRQINRFLDDLERRYPRPPGK